MKKFALTLVVLFSPVAPVLGGHVAAAQDSNSLTVQMPSANDQAPPASTTTPVQPAAPQAPRQPQDSGQTGQTGQSQPSQQDQPAAAPAQAPAQGDTSKTNPAPAEDASQAPTPAVQDSASPGPAVQTPAVAQQEQAPAAGQSAPTQDQTAAEQASDTKAGKASSAADIVASAEKQADLLGGQPGVFELDVNFAVSMNRAMVGHMELRWESKDHWWRHIEMDNFTQTMMRNGGKIYTSSNVHYVPAEVTELINLLGFAEDEASRGEIAVSVQNDRRLYGVKVQCLQTALKQLDNQPDEVCLSATSHDILSDDWKAAPDQRRKEVFTHYMAFGSYRYPGELALEVNGKRVLVANVTNLSATPFDESLLDPLKKLMQPQAPSLSIAEAK
jgi:hypothetical protein